MDEEAILQSRLMAARWMRAYAEQNPETVRISRLPDDTADADADVDVDVDVDAENIQPD